INRALLDNRRAIAKLIFNLMKSEIKKELSYRSTWKDTVEAWKLLQKQIIVKGFRVFVESEELPNHPIVTKEKENLIRDQTVLNEKRLALLQHLGDLMPPTHTKAEMNEWYRTLVNLN
ncbi:CC180 protein, partial [Upupa epops]|nr:CC180 protein [Upupa epops]